MRFDAHAALLRPDIIVIQVCINDLKTIPIFPERKQDIIDTCINNISVMIEQSRQLGVQVVMTTVFPVGQPTLTRRLFFWSDDVAAGINTINAQIHRLAAADVIILDTYTLLVGQDGLINPVYAVDTLHLNPFGYDLLNQALN